MWCKELLVCSLVVLLGNNIQAKRPIKKVLELVKEIRYDMVDEIVEALAPLLNNCGGDDDGGDGQQGIFIAGGITNQMYRTEAYYNPATNELCDIPPMMYQRESSTTTGFTSCGGYNLDDYTYLYNCETFDPSTGNWEVTAYFDDVRINHVAWQSSEGIFLMSGWGGDYNSTFIGNDGTVSAGFDMMYPASYGCAVADPSTDSVIVIAGYGDYGYSTNVTRYDVNGFVESLPPLNVGRVYAGCAGYYNDADNLVLVVTGGSGSDWPIPTETLEVGVDSYWQWHDDSNVQEISCADANNDVYCIQGYYGYNVTMWNADIEQFDLMLDTSYWRGYWGNFASSVPVDSGIGDWCMTYKQKSALPKNGDAPEKKPLKIKEQN